MLQVSDLKQFHVSLRLRAFARDYLDDMYHPYRVIKMLWSHVPGALPRAILLRPVRAYHSRMLPACHSRVLLSGIQKSSCGNRVAEKKVSFSITSKSLEIEKK